MGDLHPISSRPCWAYQDPSPAQEGGRTLAHEGCANSGGREEKGSDGDKERQGSAHHGGEQGLGQGKPTDVDKVRRTLEANLIAPYAITEALVPLLARSDDARVINHSSMLGSIGTAESKWEHVGNFMTVGYSISKAGLNMLTLIQSKTLANKGIAVAAAHPGWVKTDLGSQAAPLEVDEGARTVVDLVTMARAQFPHGQLTHKGERLPW